MSTTDPETTLDKRFSSEGATPVSWQTAQPELEQAGIYWITTVRPDGRPHVTPLIGVWLEDALHFCTGETERKARNLAENARCILTTGCNVYAEGLDVIVEGEAVRVTDDTSLQAIANAFESKYGADWHFDVRDGTFVGGGENVAQVFRVAPETAFGYSRGDDFSQTRWTF